MSTVIKKETQQQIAHSPAIQQIITSVPSWLLRWGIFIFFVLLFLIIGLSAFIKYPDIAKTTLKIESSPGNLFYGEMLVPQNKLAKIKEGQVVLIKLKRYPFETYGMITGRINYINPIPQHDSIYISRVDFTTSLPGQIELKKGMIAEAEIIIEDVSLMGRFTRSIFKRDK